MNMPWQGSMTLVEAQDKRIAALKAEIERLRKEVEHQRHNAVMRYKQWRELTEAFTEGEHDDWIVIADFTGPEIYDTETKAIGAANRNADEGQKCAVVRLMSIVDIPHHEMSREDEIAYAEEWKNV